MTIVVHPSLALIAALLMHCTVTDRSWQCLSTHVAGTTFSRTRTEVDIRYYAVILTLSSALQHAMLCAGIVVE
jgi:hypothetical protein